MEDNKYNTTTRLAENNMYEAGIAYIALPSDVDRDVYIANCYRTNTVSIYSEHNGFTPRAIIGLIGISFIEFPMNTKEFGSPVSFVVDPIHGTPIIIEVFHSQEKISDLKEHQLKFKREFNGNSVEITGSPVEKMVGVNVTSDTGGGFYVNLNSKKKDALLKMNVSGNIELDASDNTTIKQNGKFEVTTYGNSDLESVSSFSQTSDATTLVTEKLDMMVNLFKVNEGDQPIILGKKWAKFMKDFIGEIGKATTATSIGDMPLLNAEQILAYNEKVDALLSDTAFIDT